MNKAFSLLELSIVILIISLLSVGTLVGYNLRESVIINKVADDLKTIKNAVMDFSTKYNALPGDIWNASQKLVDDDGAPAIGGNGNNIVDIGPPVNEDLLFWQHLQYAGLIDGNYDGSTNIPGQGVMKGPIEGSGYKVITVNNNNLGIEFSRFRGNISGFGVFTVQQMASFDQKFDDGSPTTGNVRAINDSTQPVNCVNGNNYNLGTKEIVCVLQIIITGLSI